MEDHKTIENMGYHEKILYEAGIPYEERCELLDIVYSSASPTEMAHSIARAYNIYKTEGARMRLNAKKRLESLIYGPERM